MNRGGYLFFALYCVSIFTTCKKEGCTDINAINYDEKAKKDDGSCILKPHNNIYVSLTHYIDEELLKLDTIKYINAAGNHYSITTLKYFISDITLYKSDYSIYVINSSYYVDVTTPASGTILLKGVPNGQYIGISFIFGLDSAKNISGYFTNSPESNMEWPDLLGGGYHYMKLEGKYDSVSKVKSYNIHTGISRKIIANDTTFHQNYISIELLNNIFEVKDNEWDIELEMNINKWFTEPNDYNFDTWGSAIMGNHEAQQKIKENGNNVFNITSIHVR